MQEFPLFSRVTVSQDICETGGNKEASILSCPITLILLMWGPWLKNFTPVTWLPVPSLSSSFSDLLVMSSSCHLLSAEPTWYRQASCLSMLLMPHMDLFPQTSIILFLLPWNISQINVLEISSLLNIQLKFSTPLPFSINHCPPSSFYFLSRHFHSP